MVKKKIKFLYFYFKKIIKILLYNFFTFFFFRNINIIFFLNNLKIIINNGIGLKFILISKFFFFKKFGEFFLTRKQFKYKKKKKR